jgi:hypothetical protein
MNTCYTFKVTTKPSPFIAAAFGVLMVFAQDGFANLGSLSASEIQRTGNLVPVKTAAIQLENEGLTVQLQAETANVSVNYEFVNNGETDDVTVGFPIDLMPSHSDTTSYNIDHWQKDSLKDFAVFDGATRLAVQRTIEEALSPQDRPKGLKETSITRRWSITTLHFKRGEHKSVRVTYTVKCMGVDRGFEGTMDHAEFTTRTFLYMFRPASGWGNGHVRKLDIVVDATFLKENRFKFVTIEPKPGSDEAGILRWSFNNLDLKNAPDLACSYDSTPALFQKQAESISLKHIANLHLTVSDSESASASISSLVDRDPRSAWIAHPNKNGIGSFLELRPNKDTFISEVAILNGRITSAAEYAAYARIKKLRIDYVVRFEEGPKRESLEQVFPDRKFDDRALRFPTYYADVVDLPEGPEGLLEYIKLTVLEIYPGDKAKPLAISNLYFYGTDSTAVDRRE